MKNNYLLLFAFVLSLFFISCKKEDTISKNQFTLNGETYQLDQGAIRANGVNDDGSYDFDVTLYYTSGSIDFDNQFASAMVTGTGNFIYFDLNTDSAAGLTSGTYSYNSSPTRNAFSLADTEVGVDYNFETGNSEILFCNDGAVNITINGDDVIMDFNIEMAKGGTTSGNFSGTLNSLN